LTLPEPRIVFYARGGGIGHFNRAYAIARLLLRDHGWHPLILSTSAFLPMSLREALPVMRWPGAFEAQGFDWPGAVRAVLKTLQPELLVSDTFPEGPEQELAGLAVPHRFCLYRDPQLMLPDGVPGMVPGPADAGYILNRAPSELFAPRLARQWLRASGHKPLVLVSHNGNPAETTAFFDYLWQVLQPLEFELRLASLLPCPRPEWAPHWVTYFPLSDLLLGVDLLISGGGYNSVAEARAYGIRALFTAFERPVDRQFERIASLPHFHLQGSVSHLRSQVSDLLARERPEPVSGIAGAEYAAACLFQLVQNAA